MEVAGPGCMWVGGGYSAWNHQSPTFQEPEGGPGTSPGSGLRRKTVGNNPLGPHHHPNLSGHQPRSPEGTLSLLSWAPSWAEPGLGDHALCS